MCFAGFTLTLALAVGGCGPERRAVSAGASVRSAALPVAERRLALERARPPRAGEPSELLGVMQAELARAMSELQERGNPPPYYLAYTAYDLREVTLSASLGALEVDTDERRRVADVDVRLGDPHRDSTHSRDAPGEFAEPADLPRDADPLALRRALWLATDAAYKRAQANLIRVRAEARVNVAETDDADDFSREAPTRLILAPEPLTVDRDAWRARVRGWSARFAAHPRLERGTVSLIASESERVFVSSEGAEVQTPRTHARLLIQGEATADDGSVIERSELIDSHSLENLQLDDARVMARLDAVARDVEALARAPLGEPYVGPVILDGPAAAVFFHEIFGHRIEGHRQKSESEGQTFADKIGERLMPAFFDVYDDPTLVKAGGVDLNGFYRVDDEGVPAARATLIERGVLRGFLMSRSPVRGFPRSNGHGRRSPGYRALSRQANLVVDPAQVTTRAALTQALIAEVRRQGKPYGLRVGEVVGGYTMTQRGDTQAFKVEPVMVYRVYPDGREELVRGVTLEGTPLSALADVLAAANDFSVFNGYCGAESGDVPASAVSPSLLLGKLEITREDKGVERPPLLGAPPAEAAR